MDVLGDRWDRARVMIAHLRENWLRHLVREHRALAYTSLALFDLVYVLGVSL